MRLTRHGLHIVRGLVLPTKQQTRLDGTFDIGPSLLRLARLQTHVVARAHQGVHRTGCCGVFHLVIHVCHNVFRRRRWVHYVIQFFHHFFHRSSGVFHHLADHRITVLRRRVHGGHMLNGLLLLLLLPGRVRALGRFSLPTRIGITRWRNRVIAHIDGHPAKGCFHPHRTRLFIPWTPSWDWSAFYTHIRFSRGPIGQMTHIHIRSSRVSIGQLSLFKTVPSCPGSSFEKRMDYYKDLKRDNFTSDDEYLAERVQRGLAAGFTFQQCRHHHLIDLALALGLTQAEILTIVGPDTGYLFPNKCALTST